MNLPPSADERRIRVAWTHHLSDHNVALSGVTDCGIPCTAGRGASHSFIVEPEDPRPRWSAGTGPNHTLITQRGTGVGALQVDTLDARPLARSSEGPGP